MELKDKKILFLGDSITQGVGVEDIKDVYFKQLERNTGAQCKGYGISGTRFSKQPEADYFDDQGNFCIRCLKMDDDADIIVVFGGTNDYGHGNAPFGKLTDCTQETFCGAVSFVAKSLMEKYPKATVVFMTPTHRTTEKGRIKNENGIRNDLELVDYVDAIIKICGEYSIPVLDLYRVSGIQPNIEVNKERYMPDGLHPNVNGNAKIASRLEGFLKGL